MALWAFSLFLMCTLVTAAVDYYCPEGITSSDAALYPCLIFSKDKRSWMDALSFCETTGGTLVKIESEAQQTYVQSHQRDSEYTWFGMNDLDNEHTFLGTDGKLVTWYNWQSGQPNGNEGQNCTALDPGHQWQDKECENEYYFVCRLTARRKPVDNVVDDTIQTITTAIKFEKPESASSIELLTRLNVVDDSLCLLYCHYNPECETIAYGEGKTPFNCLLYRKSVGGYAPLWTGWRMYSLVSYSP